MKRFTSSAAVASGLLLMAAAAWLVAAQQSPPDIVLSNGKIITVDERFSIAQAIAIRTELRNRSSCRGKYPPDRLARTSGHTGTHR